VAVRREGLSRVPERMTPTIPSSALRTGKPESDQTRCTVTDPSQTQADRRAYPRTKVSVQTELHLPDRDPLIEQTSDLSLGGCYVKTMVTLPVGTKLNVGLWLEGEKVMISAMVVTCYPQVGNGIQFLAMPPADRNRVRGFLESRRDSD
jgi:c-di-GMP-binding flagellar brake protein YcgR